jgi:predicted DNA-binding transcriptional regulator AlpA
MTAEIIPLSAVNEVRPVPTPNAEPALLLPARQAASLCGVSTATWWRWDASGRIPRPLRLSAGCVRWQRETLALWIQWGCPPRKEFEALQAAKNGKR